NTGFWREEDSSPRGWRCPGRYSSLSPGSGADGKAGAAAQGSSTRAEIKRRLRRKTSPLICKAACSLRQRQRSPTLLPAGSTLANLNKGADWLRREEASASLPPPWHRPSTTKCRARRHLGRSVG